jgi:hypothetical protein
MTAPAQPDAESETQFEWNRPRRKRRIVARRLQEADRRGDDARDEVSAKQKKPAAPDAGRPKAAAAKVPGKSAVRGGNAPRRVDTQARRELAEIQNGRRSFLKKTAIGAGLLALGAGLGFGGGLAQATGLSGNSRTVITDKEIAARVIAGVRIATEFIPDPVPAGTDADPYPGSAIQTALDDGLAVYIPSGTWQLTSAISRAADNVMIVGAGKSTKLLLNGVNSVISAGAQNGWLIANLATDAGGVDVSSASQCRVTEVWVDGILTDNRPIAPGGGGGTGGYYGVRAADYIISGDGTPSSPYNASAIQNAIDALPSRGGVVFIKGGVWQGTSRITVNSTGSTPNKKVIFQGEGAWDFQIYGFSSNKSVVGTHVIAGFDIYTPCDFYDMTISPVGLAKGGDGISYIVDPNKGSSDYDWTAGLTVKRCKFFYCDTGIHFSGVNMGAVFFQVWGIEIEQCGFAICNKGFRLNRSDIDSTAPSQGVRGRILNCDIRSCTGGRGFDFDISSSKMEIGYIILEGCGSATGDYAFGVNTNGDGGVWIHNIDFGDGSVSPKDVYILIGREGRVDTIRHNKDLDLGGRMYVTGLAKEAGASGTINIVGGSTTEELTLEQAPNGAQNFTIGSVASGVDRGKIRIKHAPGSNIGYIGTTTPSGSPYTYTNLDMQDEIVYLVDGAVSGVTRGGQSVPAGAGHQLSPGDSIVISYTSPPTIKRFGLS